MTAAIDYRTDALTQYRDNRNAALKTATSPLRSSGTNVVFALSSGPTVVPFPNTQGPQPQVSENWVSRINQIKEEMRCLVLRAPGLGFAAEPNPAIDRVDFFVGALSGSRKPIFEVDPTDGEIAILWSHPEKKSSVSINIDASEMVRLVAYFADLEVQPAVKRFCVRSTVDAVKVQEALASPLYSELIAD